MNKSKRNYWVDMLIGAAFMVAAVSSVAFLIPVSWIDWTMSTTPTVLGLDYGVWQGLHMWGGIAMIAGVVVHLVLHLKWIVAMTQKTLSKRQRSEDES